MLQTRDLTNVTDLTYMLYDNKLLNQPTNKQGVSNANHMNNLFYKAENFNETLGNWNPNLQYFKTNIN